MLAAMPRRRALVKRPVSRSSNGRPEALGGEEGERLVADFQPGDGGRRVLAQLALDRISAIHDHLLRAYRYSLDVETTTSLHPLEDFLFTSKTGYPESTTPPRWSLCSELWAFRLGLVTGFLATEWNDFGGYFTVRQRDAHVSVEAYFPQSGSDHLRPDTDQWLSARSLNLGCILPSERVAAAPLGPTRHSVQRTRSIGSPTRYQRRQPCRPRPSEPRDGDDEPACREDNF